MSTAKKNPFVPAIESLEERRLMTAGVTAVLDHRVLTVTGTNGNDRISFREEARLDPLTHRHEKYRGIDADCQVYVEGAWIQDGAFARGSISRSAFDRIVINTGDGNDVVDLHSLRTTYERRPELGISWLTLMSAPDTHVSGGTGHRTLYATQGGQNFAEGPLGTNELHGAWHLVGRPKGADTFVGDLHRPASELLFQAASPVATTSPTTPAISATQHHAASDALFATLANEIQ